jgi:hypothetical protein
VNAAGAREAATTEVLAPGRAVFEPVGTRSRVGCNQPQRYVVDVKLPTFISVAPVQLDAQVSPAAESRKERREPIDVVSDCVANAFVDARGYDVDDRVRAVHVDQRVDRKR